MDNHSAYADLFRAAFRAAKMLDRHIVKDDTLLDNLEAAFRSHDPSVMADAVTRIVIAADR